MEPSVYPIRQDKSEMVQLEKEHENYLMLERLRPVDHAKVKGLIGATLFNLKMYGLAGEF